LHSLKGGSFKDGGGSGILKVSKGISLEGSSSWEVRKEKGRDEKR